MAVDYVHALVRRSVLKLNWVEEEARERERARKKASLAWASSAPADPRPNRRRDRRRELRGRYLPEYEEVPGGGQFLMMLLGRNRGAQSAAGGVEAAAEAGGARRRRTASGNSSQDDPVMHDDPAILRVEMSSPSSSLLADQLAGGSSSSRSLRAVAQHVAQGALGAEEPADSRQQSNGVPSQGDQLNLRSLLECAGILDGGSDDPVGRGCDGEAIGDSRGHGSSTHVSRASSKIFGKLQSLMGSSQEASGLQRTPQAAPVIPPMPGFAAIWGTPPDGRCTSSPALPPWSLSHQAPAAGGVDPWAPLPPSATMADGHGAAGQLPRPADALQSAPPPWQLRPQLCAPGPVASSTPSSRGRRGGKNRTRGQDLWDMPNRLDSPNDVAHLDLPEFFRDSRAPPFVGHVLEMKHLVGSAAGPPAPPPGLPPGLTCAEQIAAVVLADDDEDDEIILREQLLG